VTLVMHGSWVCPLTSMVFCRFMASDGELKSEYSGVVFARVADANKEWRASDMEMYVRRSSTTALNLLPASGLASSWQLLISPDKGKLSLTPRGQAIVPARDLSQGQVFYTAPESNIPFTTLSYRWRYHDGQYSPEGKVRIHITCKHGEELRRPLASVPPSAKTVTPMQGECSPCLPGFLLFIVVVLFSISSLVLTLSCLHDSFL
jgi:hypothetical protein